MCDNGSGNPPAPNWQGAFATIFCLGGLAINGDFLLHCTSSLNLAKGRAALRGVGVASPGVRVPTVISSLTSSWLTRGSVSCGSSYSSNNGEAAVVVEQVPIKDASIS
jgi:hypothetical protein